MSLRHIKHMISNTWLIGTVTFFLLAAGIVLYITPSLMPPAGPPVTVDTNTQQNTGGKQVSIDSYITQNISTLSPVKEQLGGTFYVTSLEAEGGKGTVGYEDGHNAYVADFTYTDNGGSSFTVTSFIIR